MKIESKCLKIKKVTLNITYHNETALKSIPKVEKIEMNEADNELIEIRVTYSNGVVGKNSLPRVGIQGLSDRLIKANRLYGLETALNL